MVAKTIITFGRELDVAQKKNMYVYFWFPSIQRIFSWLGNNTIKVVLSWIDVATLDQQCTILGNLCFGEG